MFNLFEFHLIQCSLDAESYHFDGCKLHCNVRYFCEERSVANLYNAKVPNTTLVILKSSEELVSSDRYYLFE